MSTIQCPNCQCQIKKPANVLAWVLGLMGALCFGGFMLIVVCLAAISAIGESAKSEFSAVDTELVEVSN